MYRGDVNPRCAQTSQIFSDKMTKAEIVCGPPPPLLPTEKQALKHWFGPQRFTYAPQGVNLYFKRSQLQNSY